MRYTFVFAILFCCCFVLGSDVLVFQGQYFIENEFQVGTFDFLFNVYDDEVGGNLVYSYGENLTTGNWGQWKVELAGLSAAANDTSRDYFLEVVVDGVVQGERSRVTQFEFLRKDVNEVTNGTIAAGGFASSAVTEDKDELTFANPSGLEWLRLAKGHPLFVDVEEVSVSLVSEDGEDNYAGFFYTDSDVGVIPWSWVNVNSDWGGFTLLNSEAVVSSEDDYVALGRFTADALTLGTDSSPYNNTEFSRGMDFKIFRDAVGGLAFFVDSDDDYRTTINAVLNVTGDAFFSNVSVGGLGVCLSDGTNCLNESFDFNESDYYTRVEVDALVGSTSGGLSDEMDPYWNFDKFNYYTKGEVDALIGGVDVGIQDVLVLEPSSIPSNPEVGTIYFDEDDDELRFYDGRDWYAFELKKIKVSSSSVSVRSVSDSVDEEVDVSDSVDEGDVVAEEVNVVDSEGVVDEPREVCEEVCSVEEVCEEVENCEEVCDEKGNNKTCEEVCDTETVCEEVESCEVVCGIPEMLFDIRFELDSDVGSSSDDLSGFVTFESFGSVATLVNLTFRVFDDAGNEVYVEWDDLVVLTEEVLFWGYGGEELGEGDYVVRLETLYGDGVYDEFEAGFVVRVGFWDRVLGWLGF